MPNIIGEGFSEFVLNQIQVREAKYGEDQRSTETLAYQYGKTAWVKLISGVNVEDTSRFDQTTLGDLQGIKGNKLASKFVLFNGVANESTNEQKAGIARNDSIINSAAYGLGGLEFGLRPMAGIESVNITSGPRGSLRFGEVRLKAYNRAQFEIINTLYLRLGYTVLLEWGHSNYFDNNGKYIGDNPYSLADDFLQGKAQTNRAEEYGVTKNKDLGQYDVLALVRATRKESNGNYDALYGKVSNFSWNYEKDGSYSISIKIVSMGDVIESLKLNSLTKGLSLESVPSEYEQFQNLNEAQKKAQAKRKGYDSVEEYEAVLQKQQQAIDEKLKTSAGIIESYKDKHDIGAMLYKVRQNLDATPEVGRGMSRKFYGKSGKVDAVKQRWNGKDATYYIRLGSFLQWYELTKLAVVKGKKPLIQIDYDTDSNFMYFSFLQQSADPRICMVSLSYAQRNGTILDIFKFGEKFVDTSAGPGKVMNVYLNFEFILSTIDQIISPEGNVPVLEFFEQICVGINNALGNVNKLSVVVDEDEHIIRFIDEVQLPQRDAILSKQGRSTQQGLFSLYGFREVGGISRGTFVTDYSIQTELSKDTAAMITIGAQANAAVVGEDATAFSRWNAGLIDRIEPTKELPGASNQSSSLEETFGDAVANYTKFLQDMGTVNAELPIWNESNIDTYTSFMSTMLQYKEASTAVSQGKASPTIGFLPINLALTMEGLSGMKVYQKFSVDSTFLPSTYPDSLQFIIKSIAHTIANSRWDTKIESLVVPNTISKTNETKLPGKDNKAGSRGTPAATSPSPTSATIPTSKTGIVTAIVQYAKQQGITDKNRMTAIIAVGWAETRLQPALVEGTRQYSFAGARATFSSKLKNIGDQQLKQWIAEKPQVSLYDFLYPGGGWKYRGRGLTQCTFKGNYENLKKHMAMSPFNIKADIVTNPDLLLQQDISVKALVIGKIKGLFGNALSKTTDYIGSGVAILQTQNGGGGGAMNVLSNYDAARQAVNDTEWIQELFKQEGLS